MIARIAIVAAVVAVAAAVAFVIRRRTAVDAPTQPARAVPAQLDRQDFARPDAPWLVAVFSSSTCWTCADVVAKAAVLDCADVAVADVEYLAHRDLHTKYVIDSVPCLVLADAGGVVRASFLGPVTATDLWAAVAEARYPGTSPEPDLGRT